ncbi:MAG: glycosyl transferase family 2 [Phenylobacterium sp.]|nr:glycosyl transferase family 2 [Phenylobacterium sp.]
MSVSVLIPAFRPAFLGQAIASVLAQGHEDFELIVSDDSGADEVLPVVERFRDPRVRYVATAGRTGGIENMRGLWKLAKHDLVKYLFDDDLLMPHALGELVDEVEATPDVSVVFARRQKIDERGRLLDPMSPFSWERARLDQSAIARSLVGTISNPIGEFSNILINRAAGVLDTDFVCYEGYEMQVVADVGFFLNAARRAPCAGLNRLIGSFRIHANQNSSPAFNPLFAIGICEWELFIRGEYSCGALPAADALKAIDKLGKGYVNWSRSLPVIAQMAAGLDELRLRVEQGETAVLDDAFRSRWNTFVQCVMDAKAQREVSPQA